MNASYCARCGNVFPMGTKHCDGCASTADLVELKPGRFIPVSFYNDKGVAGFHRDPDFGKRWVAIPVGDESALVEPDTAAKVIMMRGRRVRGPYDPETLDRWITCKDDWETADGLHWTIRWTFALTGNAGQTDVRCEVVA